MDCGLIPNQSHHRRCCCITIKKKEEQRKEMNEWATKLLSVFPDRKLAGVDLEQFIVEVSFDCFGSLTALSCV